MRHLAAWHRLCSTKQETGALQFDQAQLCYRGGPNNSNCGFLKSQWSPLSGDAYFIIKLTKLETGFFKEIGKGTLGTVLRRRRYSGYSAR